MNGSPKGPETGAGLIGGPVGAGGIGGRFVALDSWRGICALAVALFHLPVAGSIADSAFVRSSYLFVDFFFVLSGFVIATAYDGRLNDAPVRLGFLIRRFGRLWPLHVAMLAVFVAASIAKGELGADEQHSVGAIATNLIMIHGLGVHHALTWNGPSWSISVEMLLYVGFFLLSFVRQRLPIYLVIIALSIAVLAFYAPHGMGSTFDFGVFRGLAGFFLGAVVARLPRARLGLLFEIGTVALVLIFVTFVTIKVFAPLVFGLAVYVFAHSRGGLNRVLTLKPFVRLGDWSYSIYMVHAAVVAAICGIGPRIGFLKGGAVPHAPTPLLGDVLAVGYLAAVVATAAVTYTVIENPTRRLFNRIAARAVERAKSTAESSAAAESS